MRKTLSVLSIIGLFILSIYSCQKEGLSDPAVVANGSGGAAFSIGISTSGLGSNNTLCAGSSFTLNVEALNPGGQPLGDGAGNREFRILAADQSTVVESTTGTSGSWVLTPPTPATLPGTYTYYIEFYLNSQKVFASSITLNIIDCSINPPPPIDCGAYDVLFTQKDVIYVSENFTTGRFVQEFKIYSCDYNGPFKLQGGLTNGASLNAATCLSTDPVSETTPGYTILKDSKNTVLNWISGKSGKCGATPQALTAGEERIYKVDFNKTIKSWQTDSYGQFDYLTGAWSVKADGALLAPYGVRLKVYKTIVP